MGADKSQTSYATILALNNPLGHKPLDLPQYNFDLGQIQNSIWRIFNVLFELGFAFLAQ
jgi:hypothetical protein